MKVITDEPMGMAEMCFFTGRDALLKTESMGNIRILNAAGGQEIEVENIAIIKGKKFGLRKRKSSNNTAFDYIGVLIK